MELSFSMRGGPQFTQFFMASARQSLLGPAPRGIPMRGPRAMFTPGPYSHPHGNYPNKNTSAQCSEKRKDIAGAQNSEGHSSSITLGEPGKAVETTAVLDESNHASSQQHDEPPVKKQKPNVSLDGPVEKTSVRDGVQTSCDRPLQQYSESRDFSKTDVMNPPSPARAECVEEGRIAEFLGAGSSLKVTIRQSNESRACSMGVQEPATHSQDLDPDRVSRRFFCYICNTTCPSQQVFWQVVLHAQTSMFNHQSQQFQHPLRSIHPLLPHQRPQPPQPQTAAAAAAAAAASAQQMRRHPAYQVQRTMAPTVSRMPSAGPGPLLPGGPMMQRAMFMQGMQSFSMRGGPQFTQFFMASARQSLLGPAPRGIPMRGPRAMFTPGPYSHPHGNYPNKNTSAQCSEKRKDIAGAQNSEGHSSSITLGEPGKAVETTAVLDESNHASSQQHDEPPVKKQKPNVSLDGPVEKTSVRDGVQTSCDRPLQQYSESRDFSKTDVMNPPSPARAECVEEGRIAEFLGAGSSLKVTIRQSNESRACSMGVQEPATHSQDLDPDRVSRRFFCYICNTTCPSQQNFQSHMNSLEHQQRMMEIQQMSNACLASLLPHVQESLQNTQREKRPGIQRWCTTCQEHFTGDIIEHRRTKEHKQSKNSLRPLCTVCKRHFRTPRKFVEHMKSPEHKQRVEELREEGEPEILEELITVDAVGCFEGEDDYEEEEEDIASDQPADKEVALEEMGEHEEYNEDTQYGSSFVVPVAGFLCRLCHKFFHFESTALQSHCKSLMHFQNMQKYQALKKQSQPLQEERKLPAYQPETQDRLPQVKAEEAHTVNKETHSGFETLQPMCSAPPNLAVVMKSLTNIQAHVDGSPGTKKQDQEASNADGQSNSEEENPCQSLSAARPDAVMVTEEADMQKPTPEEKVTLVNEDQTIYPSETVHKQTPTRRKSARTLKKS
ncbi:cdkn1a interacting zinc finger protein 1b isoform X2 [Denticeps clupeoides]|uniref:cdkn1a interacting zinc finger protein 1b isoform X2 n=1 Tax=Denticeps clupeoides TaxID=299321 RepID=UPI0010A4817F|nr:uncharacterized protein LOC114799013 isoform X2 [Denticeps clupeoides]